MKILSIVLVVFSLIVVTFGLLISKGAPQESVVVGLGCFLGIMARIAQASAHHGAISKQKEGNIEASQE